jgi:hypothetical protein
VNLAQLIYRSTSVTGAASALQMSDILAQARPRNAQLGVTGVLTAVGGEFVQIIEGPKAGVTALLASLVLDPRHRHVRVLERRRVDRRAFGDWEMVSPRLAALEASQIALLLSADVTEIATYIPLLQRAIVHQDAVLEGLESPVSMRESGRPGAVPSLAGFDPAP